MPKPMLLKLVRKDEQEEDRGKKPPVLLARPNRLAKRLGRASRGDGAAGGGGGGGARRKPPPALLARPNRLAKRLGRASRGYALAGAGVVVGAVMVVSLLSWLAPDSDRPGGAPRAPGRPGG